MKKLTLIVFCLILFGPTCLAGEIAAGMLDSFWQDTSEYKKVFVILADQVDVKALNQEFETARFPLSERHRVLLDSLKTRADRTQATIQNSLDILVNAGMVRAPRSHWLVNMLVCETTKAGAELLANITDVAEVGAAETIYPRTLIDSEPAEAALLNVEAPLRTIRAPEAWAKGFYGTGRIVCLLDQAVRLNHPSLAERWRGKTASAEQSMYGAENLVSLCNNDRLEILGAACGADPARGDTIGVAPGAEWIAGNLFCQTESDFDQLITLLEWAVDPDNQNETFSDVPDVICMSWSVGEACQSMLPSRVWSAFYAAEASGPVCVFASSNDGERGTGSVGLPEGYAGTFGSFFSIGNFDDSSPTHKVHAASGRGPSPCDGKLVKPDLVAPGTNVRTAFGDSYVKATGTSAALGYAAGTIALMREANSELTAEEIKDILGDTSVDLGLSGKDNVYGWGLLNCARAVETAKSIGSSGTIRGLVRYGGIPLGNASVELVSAFGSRTTLTLPNGSYVFENLPTDREYGLRIARFGFAPFVSENPIILEKNGEHSGLINLKSLVFDNVEFDQGWLYGVEGDDATEGIWERAIPVPSSDKGSLIQVDSDVTEEGEYCFVTANAPSADDPAGTADVDGGQTTLRSPMFSLRELEEPELTFYYDYSNDKGGQRGGDFFRAQISNDGGMTWTDLIRTSVSTNGWKDVTLKLDDFIASTDSMMLQFIADDRPPATLVEAAIDEIKITGKPGAPEPPRDLQIDVVGEEVFLTWKASEGASRYTVYLAGTPDQIVLPRNYLTETSDTTFVIRLDEIPYDQFYFQVTASR